MNKEILLSIYPVNNERIKSKLKNFEFRPYSIISETGFLTMWIYETKPTMQIKYRMVVKNPIIKLTEDIHYGLGDDQFYRLISEGKYAYEIVSFHELIEPIPLQQMRVLSITPPQGYAYLTKYPTLSKILSAKQFIQHF